LRKIAAISFILILAFNLCGYRLLISVLQTKADAKLEARIDNNDYDESQLVEMRVALNLPYQERYTEFERHYGEIMIDGKAYTYVKRKMEGDVLVLKCIANECRQQLKKTADNLAKSNSGQEQENNGKKQSSSLLKTFSGEYDDKNNLTPMDGIAITAAIPASSYIALLKDALIKTPYQPPKC
jgi:hypothetical protein